MWTAETVVRKAAACQHSVCEALRIQALLHGLNLCADMADMARDMNMRASISDCDAGCLKLGAQGVGRGA